MLNRARLRRLIPAVMHKSSAAVSWYLSGGASPVTVYEPYRMGSLDWSYLNTLVPSISDAKNVYVAGNPPALSAGAGWDFSGASNLALAADLSLSETSVLVFWMNPTGNGGGGGYGVMARWDANAIIYPRTVETTGRFKIFEATLVTFANLTTTGVLVQDGKTLYKDNVSLGTAGAGTGTSVKIYLGNGAGLGNNFAGVIGAFALYSSLTAAQRAAVTTALNAAVASPPDYGTKKLTILGHSIPFGSFSSRTYGSILAAYMNKGFTTLTNRAVSGASIVAASNNLADQVTAAASDDADIIIIDIGLNDDNAGNMTTLQNTLASAISTLKGTNSRATIYVSNILPAWADNTTGPETEKGNIRTAIAAAAAAQSVTCWDTYTTPWILQTDTHDGWHPEAGGHVKIANQMMTRLGLPN